MQQRFQLGLGAEIPGLAPEQDIRGEGGDRDKALGEILQVARHEDLPGDRQAEQHDQEQGRQDAARPAFVKGEQAEAPGLHFAGDDRGDQETADHEENVDADKATAEQAKAGMEEDDGDNRDGSQPVDLGAVRALCRHGKTAPSPWARESGGKAGSERVEFVVNIYSTGT